MEKDYYQILGVDKNASQQQIKEAYRKLAFQYHPDRNQGNPAASERMKEINEAYATLSDSRKRSEYDSLRQQFGSFGYERFRQRYSEEDIFRGSDINQIFEEFARAFGFRNFDEIFRDFYGSGYRSFEFQKPGIFGRGFVFFGPFERYSQRLSEEQKKFYQTEEAPAFREPFLFKILGKIAKYGLKKISGIEFPEKGKDWYDVITLTPEEVRKGEIKYHHRRKLKDLMVKIPSEVREGRTNTIKLRGMGVNGKGGGEPGDLYLKVRIRTPLLQRVKKFLR